MNATPSVGVVLTDGGIGISNRGEPIVEVLLSLELLAEIPSTSIESDDVKWLEVFWADELMATAASALVGVLASIGGRMPMGRILFCVVDEVLGHSSKLRRNSVIWILSSAIWMALSRMFRDCFFCCAKILSS